MTEDASAENKWYLELSKDPIRFESVNQLTNVFFDDSNNDVFAVRSGGVMGVVVKGPDKTKPPLNFRMEDQGPVLSIKFSLDHKILAVQRNNNSVEFMNFNGVSVDTQYSQCCKKNANILGFVWSHENEVALITDHGIELYLVIPNKKSLKHLKSVSATVQWFVWCSVNKIALLASAHGSQLQPVSFKQATISKLQKVETEPGRMALERDVTLATLYGTPSVLILRHQSGHHSAEVHIHTLNGPCLSPVKSHVLRLGMTGRFAINVVDDLILVHHQASRSSKLFDIALAGESDGSVQYHKAIAPAKSFKPVSLDMPSLTGSQTHICELYSPNWVVFQPNIVIDAKLGCLWHISLKLPELFDLITDLGICTEVALNRTNAKQILLDIILSKIQLDKPPLIKLQESFNHINKVYRDSFKETIIMQTSSPNPQAVQKPPPRVLIDQEDIYREILQPLDNEKSLQKLEWILISYITSLSSQSIPVQHNLNDLLILTLARRNRFTALQQMLQYGVVADSKLLACVLLSLSNMHPAAAQLALDMLARIDAKEEIQEILLSEGQVLSALKLAQESASMRKFLMAAKKSDNEALFHSVLFYFRTNPQFMSSFIKDERLLSFVQEYNSMFNIEPNSIK